MPEFRTKTKIVATLGPSSNDYETIKKLIDAKIMSGTINTIRVHKIGEEQ